MTKFLLWLNIVFAALNYIFFTYMLVTGNLPMAVINLIVALVNTHMAGKMYGLYLRETSYARS